MATNLQRGDKSVGSTVYRLSDGLNKQRRVFAAKTLPMEYKSAGKQCTRQKWQKIRLCSKFKLYICTSFRQHSVTFPSLAVKFFLKLFQKNYFVSSISNPTLKFAKVSLMWANHWTVSSGRVQSFFYSEIFSKTFSVSAQSVNPPTGIPTKAPKCNVAD